MLTPWYIIMLPKGVLTAWLAIYTPTGEHFHTNPSHLLCNVFDSKFEFLRFKETKNKAL